MALVKKYVFTYFRIERQFARRRSRVLREKQLRQESIDRARAIFFKARSTTVQQEECLPNPAHFGFTKLLVTDLDTALNFYRDVAGVTEMARVDDEIAGRKISEIICKPNYEGAATFVLLKFLDQGTPSKDEAILGFITENVDAFADRAVAAGGKIVSPAKDMPHHGVRVSFMTDNEGHLLEVVQMLK